MNNELLPGFYTADKIAYEREYNRKNFGKVRIPRKQLSPQQKKSKRKMTKASRKANRR